MSKYLPLTTILSLTVTLLGCGPSIAQHPATPAGWTEHKDSAGFIVDLPKGWAAETGKDRHLMFHSPDSKEFAYALPFESPNGGSAGEWIKPIVQHLSALLPDAQIVSKDQVGGGQDEATAKLTFAQGGKPAQANVLCAIANGRGVFYAIAAPADMFTDKKPVLCKILESVRPLENVSTTSGSAATSSSANPSYITWTEPNEHAFTVEVPKGWKVTGGIFRYAPIDVRPQVDAGSPDGQIHLKFGDANLSTFAAPGPSSKIRGLSEGQSYPVNGVMYTVMHPVSGTEFSKAYVERNISKNHADVKVTGTKDLPDEAAQANSKFQQQRMQVHDSCGETDFTYTENGKTVSGVCHVRTEVWGQGLGQTWTAYPIVAMAAPDRLDVAKSVAQHMVQTTVEDPQWTAQVQKTVAEFTKMVMQNHEAAMQQIHDTYEKYTRNMAENQRQWSNIINNTSDVVNKQTGETMHVDGNYSYYFAGGGGVVGSNSANGGGLTPLTKY